MEYLGVSDYCTKEQDMTLSHDIDNSKYCLNHNAVNISSKKHTCTHTHTKQREKESERYVCVCVCMEII